MFYLEQALEKRQFLQTPPPYMTLKKITKGADSPHIKEPLHNAVFLSKPHPNFFNLHDCIL